MKTLKQRVERIREIDQELTKLFAELHKEYYEDLSMEEHNRLFDMVSADGKPHYIA